MAKKKTTLFSKLIISCIAPFMLLFPLLLLLTFSIINNQNEENYKQNIETLGNNLTQSVARNGQHLFRNSRFISEELPTDPSNVQEIERKHYTSLLTNFLLTGDNFEGAYFYYFSESDVEDPFFEYLVIDDKNGSLGTDDIVSIPYNETNIYGAGADWFYPEGKIPQSRYEIFPSYGPDNTVERFITMVSSPIFDDNGDLIGITGSVMKDRFFFDFLKEFLKDETYGIMIAQSNGAIIYAQEPQIDSLKLNGKSYLGLNVQDVFEDEKLLNSITTSTKYTGKTGSLYYDGASLYHVVPLSFGSGANTLYLIIDFPLAPSIQRLTGVIALLLLTGFAFILIISLALYIALRRDTNSIKELTGLADTISKGNYLVELELELANREDSTMEMDLLYKSLKAMIEEFKSMVNDKDSFNTKLENRIEERTQELIQKTEEAREEKLKAEEALKTETTFISNMSHEIRTPLNAITSMTKLLDAAETDTVKKGYMNIIIKASETLLDTINDLLDISKMEATEFEIINKDYKITELLEHVSNVLNIRASEKDLTFSINVNPNMPSVYNGDVERISQILLNLLANAVKFTEKGSISLDVDYDSDSDELRFAVLDTGIGLKPDDLPMLFDSARQKERLRNKEIEGTRLGLAVSQSLATAMNGRISVESEYGMGSTFYFSLPQTVVSTKVIAEVKSPENKKVIIFGDVQSANMLSKMIRQLGVRVRTTTRFDEVIDAIHHDEATHLIYNHVNLDYISGLNDGDFNKLVIAMVRKFSDLADREHASKISLFIEPVSVIELAKFIDKDNKTAVTVDSSQETPLSQVKAQGVKALIVDDNMVNLITAREILKQYNINSDVAENGEEAIQMVGNEKYDIIFMDHMMPGLDGIETSARIREVDEWNKNVPIIALTANAISGIKEFYIENGLNDFISKPIDFEELDRVLVKWVNEDKISIYKKNEFKDAFDSPEEKYTSKIIQKMCVLDLFNVDVAIKRFGGNESIFVPVVLSLGKAIRTWDSKLLTYSGAKNWPSFRIEVHAQKSSLASVGCTELAKRAAFLEESAVNGDIIDIGNAIGDYINDIRNLRDVLFELISNNYIDDSETSKFKFKGEGDFASLGADLVGMKERLEELNPEMAYIKCRELEKYDFGYSINAKIRALKSAIDDFRYDFTLELIEDINQEIERSNG